MPHINLIAVDLDGTLLTSEGKPAEEGSRMLRRAAESGVRVIIATTRALRSSLPVADALGLSDPIICMNGAQVWSAPRGPLWSQRTIPVEAARILARAADQQGWSLSITVEEVTFWTRRAGQENLPPPPGRQWVDRNEDALVGDPVRILVNQPEAVQALHQICVTRLAGRCRADLFHDSRGIPESMSIIAAGADKKSALALVLARLGVAAGNTLAIGDNFNDVPMFELAGVRVAMGSAADAVKAQAGAVAPDNDHEGVAWAVKTFVFGESSHGTTEILRR